MREFAKLVPGVAAATFVLTLSCSGVESEGYPDPGATGAVSASTGETTTTTTASSTASAVGSGGATGNSGSVTSGVPGTPSYAEVASLLGRTCGTASCHGKKQLPLIKDDAALPGTLLETTVEECGNAPLVHPGQPETSALILLVRRQCGTLVMPNGCTSEPCLPQETVDTISAWIAGGAPMQ